MRIIVIGFVILCGQGCVGDDYYAGKKRYGSFVMSAEERYKCEMDSLRPGCQFYMPRQEVK